MHRDRWKYLRLSERAAFIAQLLATLSLFPTVYFAWASYREVRQARQEQAQYFYAEKAARLIVKSVEIDSGRVIAHVENAGESPATQILAQVALLGTKDGCGFREWNENSQPNYKDALQRGDLAHLWIDSLKSKLDKCLLTQGKKEFDAQPASFNRSDAEPYFSVLVVWRTGNNQELARTFEAPAQSR